MPIKEDLNDATLYFVDTETGERSIFNGISEIDTVPEAEKWGDTDKRIISCDIARGDSETAVFWIKNFSTRNAYLMCLKAGVDVFWVPNNFRRMHGYRARRLSLRKRRAMKASKKALEEAKSAIKTSPIIEYMNLYRFCENLCSSYTLFASLCMS